MVEHKTGNHLGNLLLLISLLLTSFGFIAIYASSSLKGAQLFNDEFFFVKKQFLNACLGYFLVWIILIVPFKYIERAVLPSLLIIFFLLALIFVPGAYHKVGGASRWLNIPYIGGQPGELTKIVFVLFLAKNLSRPANKIHDFLRGILPNFIILSLIVGLLLIQKDLGTPMLLICAALSMLIVAGIPIPYLTALSLGVAGAFFAAVALEPYRWTRLVSFLDPWSQAQGHGFQIIQSFVAFANGGFFGSGLGESKQKLFFLPEAHTDFIVAVVTEELGLIGLMSLIAAFICLATIGFYITRLQTINFRKFLSFGLTSMLTFQVLLNMGVAVGILPTKGMALPFISSGSSSLLVSLLSIGILAKLARGIDTSDDTNPVPPNLG